MKYPSDEGPMMSPTGNVRPVPQAIVSASDASEAVEALQGLGAGRVVWAGEPPSIKQYPTAIAAKIIESLLPEWREQFLRKNAGYGEGGDLGMRGEFVEIHRKTMKLKRALWEGNDIGDEGVREVAMDLIGHAFLLIALHDGPEGLSHDI